MIRKLREMQEKEEGFTLIELLVVVIIIGILAAIAIPQFLNQREAGYQAAIVSDTRNASLEVEAEITKKAGTLPTETEGEAIVDGMGTSHPTYASLDYKVNAAGTGFCVTGTDSRVLDNAATPAAVVFVYDSLKNGMQNPGTACSF